MSTKNPTHGTKVTDPNAPKIHEGAGAVAKDSLAAQSSEFQEENRNSAPLGVSGSNSTLANSNTSGAIKLNSATDKESRSTRSQEENHGGVRGHDSGSSNPSGSGSSAKHVGSADIAPTYVNSQAVDHAGPKGKNLKEDENLTGKNASFNNEIGTKNDPGRLAEQSFEQINADGGGQAGLPRQSGSGDGNQYETLKDTTA